QKVVPDQVLDQARADFETSKAHVEALHKQVEAQRATVALARSNAEQNAVRSSQLATNQHQLAAADAQRTKADVRLAYTEMRAPMHAIDVREIVKRFGDFTAVGGVSFAVEEGEIFGLLGPNGAGKSTLIRMLTTLLLPSAGTATVNGFDIVKEQNGVRNSIGV